MFKEKSWNNIANKRYCLLFWANPNNLNSLSFTTLIHFKASLETLSKLTKQPSLDCGSLTDWLLWPAVECVPTPVCVCNSIYFCTCVFSRRQLPSSLPSPRTIRSANFACRLCMSFLNLIKALSLPEVLRLHNYFAAGPRQLIKCLI